MRKPCSRPAPRAWRTAKCPTIATMSSCLNVRPGPPPSSEFHTQNTITTSISEVVLWEKRGVFLRELNGNAQLVVALSYVLRQPVHHGVSHSPFNYPFSSINCYFREELGKNEIVHCIPDAMIASYLPRRATIPPRFKMGYNGMFTRESVTEHRLTELQYGTYGTFSFYMTRRSSEQWREEQLRNNAGVQPLVLGDIEEGLLAHDPEGAASLRTMQSNESKKFLLPANDDLALCKIIDRIVLHEFRLSSVYQLADGQRAKLAQCLLTRHHAHMDQIRRCLYFK